MVYRRYYPLSLSLAGAGVDARRLSALLNITQYTQYGVDNKMIDNKY